MTYTPKPTEEYLAWIEMNKYLYCREGKDYIDACDKCAVCRSFNANRDVLVRHETTNGNVYPCCTECRTFTGNLVQFPCPTYLDIAKRLDEVM